jgi:hypothetical protein
MTPYKIGYKIKDTRSNNTYVDINTRDEQIFHQTIVSINCYMQELCLSLDKDIVVATNWYRSPDKRFPFNKRLSRRNTPESMIAGLLNNMFFGNQKNLSLEQLPYYEEIVNTCIDIIEEFRTSKGIDLQSKPYMTKIMFGLDI